MKIELNEIVVRDLVNGYQNNEEHGVISYNGKLDIRPPYQREFIYKDMQRDAVINTITKEYPLNVIYWSVRDDGTFEVIDGQQRILSICKFVNGDFHFNGRYYYNLHDDEQEQILNYKLMVYFCEGNDSEKLEWFKTINIAGEELTEQELRNAVYAGSWVTDAKRYFSKHGCSAYKIGGEYLKGELIRQDYLETVLKWISNNNIEQYMAKNQHEETADELWLYFQNTINWVKTIFPIFRKEMKGIDWGFHYNKYKDEKYNSKEIEKKVSYLMEDEDVTNKKGIYLFILTNDPKHLNIRTFGTREKRQAYEKQKGNCIVCGNHFEINEMEADHIIPWSEGGQTIYENCQLLCKSDNRRKANK